MKTPSNVLMTLLLLLLIFGVGCKPSQSMKPKLMVAINSGPEGQAIKFLAPLYNGAEIIIVDLPYSSLRQQLITTLGNGENKYDVIMVDDPWFPQIAPKLARLDHVPDSLLVDIIPASLSLCKYPYGDGELRALPFVGNTQLLFYRSDIVRKLGIKEIPAVWEDLAEMTNRISASHEKSKGSFIYGYAIRGRAGAPIVTDFLPIYWSLGGHLPNNDGNTNFEAIDSSKFVNALKIYRKLLLSSPPGAANFDWSEMTAAFTNGQAVFQLNWPAAIPIIDSSIKIQTGEKGWEIALPPGSPKSPGTSMIGNWLLAIPNNSNNVESAEKFIIWLMEKQGLVASSGNPPTRSSVFDTLASKPNMGYFQVIKKALALSTPRTRTEKWAQIEDIISRRVSSYLNNDITENQADSLTRMDLNSLYNKK